MSVRVSADTVESQPENNQVNDENRIISRNHPRPRFRKWLSPMFLAIFVLLCCTVATPLVVVLVNRHGNISIFSETRGTSPAVLSLARVTMSVSEISISPQRTVLYKTLDLTPPHQSNATHSPTVLRTHRLHNKDDGRVRAYFLANGVATWTNASSASVVVQAVTEQRILVPRNGMISKLRSKDDLPAPRKSVRARVDMLRSGTTGNYSMRTVSNATTSRQKMAQSNPTSATMHTRRHLNNLGQELASENAVNVTGSHSLKARHNWLGAKKNRLKKGTRSSVADFTTQIGNVTTGASSSFSIIGTSTLPGMLRHNYTHKILNSTDRNDHVTSGEEKVLNSGVTDVSPNLTSETSLITEMNSYAQSTVLSNRTGRRSQRTHDSVDLSDNDGNSTILEILQGVTLKGATSREAETIVDEILEPNVTYSLPPSDAPLPLSNLSDAVRQIPGIYEWTTVVGDSIKHNTTTHSPISDAADTSKVGRAVSDGLELTVIDSSSTDSHASPVANFADDVFNRTSAFKPTSLSMEGSGRAETKENVILKGSQITDNVKISDDSSAAFNSTSSYVVSSSSTSLFTNGDKVPIGMNGYGRMAISKTYFLNSTALDDNGTMTNTKIPFIEEILGTEAVSTSVSLASIEIHDPSPTTFFTNMTNLFFKSGSVGKSPFTETNDQINTTGTATIVVDILLRNSSESDNVAADTNMSANIQITLTPKESGVSTYYVPSKHTKGKRALHEEDYKTSVVARISNVVNSGALTQQQLGESNTARSNNINVEGHTLTSAGSEQPFDLKGRDMNYSLHKAIKISTTKASVTSASTLATVTEALFVHSIWAGLNVTAMVHSRNRTGPGIISKYRGGMNQPSMFKTRESSAAANLNGTGNMPQVYNGTTRQNYLQPFRSSSKPSTRAGGDLSFQTHTTNQFEQPLIKAFVTKRAPSLSTSTTEADDDVDNTDEEEDSTGPSSASPTVTSTSKLSNLTSTEKRTARKDSVGSLLRVWENITRQEIQHGVRLLDANSRDNFTSPQYDIVNSSMTKKLKSMFSTDNLTSSFLTPVASTSTFSTIFNNQTFNIENLTNAYTLSTEDRQVAELNVTIAEGNDTDVPWWTLKPEIESILSTNPVEADISADNYYDDRNDTIPGNIFEEDAVLNRRLNKEVDRSDNRPTEQDDIFRTDYYDDETSATSTETRASKDNKDDNSLAEDAIDDLFF